MKVSKDTPINEITLRKYEKPYNLAGRDLVKKFCLSIGLLQPGDSRDIIVDIFLVLLQNKKKQVEVNSDELRSLVIESRRVDSLSMLGVAASNIRRQLKRLRDMHLVEKKLNNYKITEFDTLYGIFNEKISKFILQPSTDRIVEYIKKLDDEF